MEVVTDQSCSTQAAVFGSGKERPATRPENTTVDSGATERSASATTASEATGRYFNDT